MVAKVLVELSNRNIDKCFTYNVPLELEKNIKVGIRVEVPFGKQYLEGFVLELSSDACDEIELKDIKRLVDNEVILNDELLKLGEYIKDKTLCTLISAYQVMLPKALKAKNNTNINKLYEKYIELNIGSMVDDYGKLFNGHSTLENFYDEQIVSFEIKNLAQFDKRVFNAQTFNIMTMLWNNALKKGSVAKKLYDNREVSFEDSQKFFVLIDEAHKFINSDNLMAVDYAIAFEREARKYFAGLMFATQSIRDVVPENISSEALHKIKTLFELTQYRFIMQQDNNSKEALKEIFDGQITESEIERVPTFKKGECILAINGYKNIKLNIEITDKEKQLFAGGA